MTPVRYLPGSRRSRRDWRPILTRTASFRRTTRSKPGRGRTHSRAAPFHELKPPDGRQVAPGLRRSPGPGHVEAVDPAGRTQAEEDLTRRRGEVAPAADQVADDRQVSCTGRDAGADRRAT